MGNVVRTGEREHFLQKVVELARGKKTAGGFCFEHLKNKELLVAPGQESVVLAAKVENLGHCLQRGKKLFVIVLPFLCYTSHSSGFLFISYKLL